MLESIIFLVPFSLSVFYSLYALFRVLRFKYEHGRGEGKAGDLTACILRPLHGSDQKTYVNLSSLCRQSKLPAEIRYGVDDPDDPAVRVVEQLKKDFPEIQMHLVIVSGKDMPNRKMANLTALSEGVRFPVIVAIDQDIFTEESHLEEVFSSFASPETGLVTSLYRIDNPETLGTALELLAVHVDFFPSVLVAEKIEKGLGFAFGATMAFRREVLEKIGGFEGFGDYLADDHELGARIRKSGHNVVLSGSIARHDPGRLSLRDYWDRQIRAARTYRVCRPFGYALSILTQGIPWTAGLCWVSGFSSWTIWLFAFWLFGRFVLAASSHAILTKKAGPWWPILLLPVHEVMRFVFWIAAFTGNKVIWGKKCYEVFGSGKMRELRKD